MLDSAHSRRVTIQQDCYNWRAITVYEWGCSLHQKINRKEAKDFIYKASVHDKQWATQSLFIVRLWGKDKPFKQTSLTEGALAAGVL